MSAPDGLAAEDLFGLSAAGLLDRTAVLVAARNRIDAELARTVRRAELAQAAEHDGLKTMASWLRGHARLSPTAAGQLVRNGRALEQLPAMAAAFADGAVTAEQVGVLAPVTRPETLTGRRRPGRRAGRGRPRAGRGRRPPPARPAGPGGGPLSGPAGPRRPRTRPHRGPVAGPGTPTDGCRCAGSWTPWAGRRWPPRWNRWCRPTGRPVTGGPAPSSWATRWCSWPTTRSPPHSCRSCARSS